MLYARVVLTTAAGLWLTAAIGMACGMGLGVTALIATALAMVPRNSDGSGCRSPRYQHTAISVDSAIDTRRP